MMETTIIFLTGYFSGAIFVCIFQWLKNRQPFKLITKNEYLNQYDKIQEFHKNKFKKLINNELRNHIKKGKFLPITIDYLNVFSEHSLHQLRNYIEFTLKFPDFELNQKEDWVICRLVLRY